MKRLYENIERIDIQGGIEQLSEVVSSIDISLQNIADYSDMLANFLIRYSVSNKGLQFEKVIDIAMFLRDKLYNASIAMNDMQNQIVAYQNKIYRYEGMSAAAQLPNAYLVQRRNIDADTFAVQFDRTEMIEVASYMETYSEQVLYELVTIKYKKDAIAAVWRDPQYYDFADFVDDVIKTVLNAVEIFDDYVISLKERIQEMD